VCPLTLVNNSMLSASDFMEWGGACQLTEAGRRAFLDTYERRKATIVTHPLFGYKMATVGCWKCRRVYWQRTFVEACLHIRGSPRIKSKEEEREFPSLF
jgi:hypothetical protein